jgi:HSP20 family protein
MTNTIVSTMTGLALPAPFLEGLRNGLERLADGPLAPGLDLYRTPEAVVAKVALPGVKRQDVDISVGDNLVTITGSSNHDSQSSQGDYVHKELRQGSFSRSFWLPAAVRAEAATASLEDGLLTLTLPKTDRLPLKRVKVEVA